MVRYLIKGVFIFLVTLFLFYLFLKYNQLSGFGHLAIDLFIFIGAFIFTFIIASLIDIWMDKIHFKFTLQLICSLLLILFFVYKMFTPYFYTEQHLKENAMDKIELYYQLSNNELSEEERINLAEASHTELMAFNLTYLNRYPEEELVEIEVKDFRRYYYQYHIVVELELLKQTQLVKETNRYIFTREGFDFKIGGRSFID
ncbi:hypothetical protein [Chengkuizengella axinellae]|uniref:Uncharacterized protein n=1 Tax=Chengkuizengella axinellae TaxID=3064388 RepID=A0ABT9J325_9BACL|nr:hypothetical protein [Chengkuizengella sp. 2205SS18-9]MDP5275993.1 hypothetical protein [Chengkuizengella sp. 2205SS18-9]